MTIRDVWATGGLLILVRMQDSCWRTISLVRLRQAGAGGARRTLRK
jgi:hypothetical protein